MKKKDLKKQVASLTELVIYYQNLSKKEPSDCFWRIKCIEGDVVTWIVASIAPKPKDAFVLPGCKCINCKSSNKALVLSSTSLRSRASGFHMPEAAVACVRVLQKHYNSSKNSRFRLVKVSVFDQAALKAKAQAAAQNSKK